MVGGWLRRFTLCGFRESNEVSVCFPRDTWDGAKMLATQDGREGKGQAAKLPLWS